MKPHRWAPFCVGLRIAAIGATCAGFRAGGLASLLGAWAAFTLLRVPLRILCVEIALVFAASFALTTTFAFAFASVFTLALALLAPESGELPLTAMDRFFIVNDYPGLPMHSIFFLDLKDAMEEPALRKALAAVMAEIPMARTFVRQAPWGLERFVARRAWIDTARLIVRAETPIEEDSAPVDAPFDLAREPPIRMILTRRRGGAPQAVLIAHHSAIDGEGGLLFLDVLMRRYHEALRSRPASALPPIAAASRFRDRLREKGLGYAWRMIRRHLRPFAKIGAKHATLHDDRNPQPTRPVYRLFDLAPETWRALKGTSVAFGCSRNDLLIAATLRACLRLVSERGQRGPSVCVSSAVSLRKALGLGAGFQNFLGTMILTLAPEEIERTDLPSQVARKGAELRELDQALAYPVNLGVLTRLLPPPFLRAVLRKLDADRESFFFTCMTSTMRVTHEYEGVERVGTASSMGRRPGIGITFTITGERVACTLEWAAPIITEPTAQLLKTRFTEELARFVSAEAAA